MGWEGSLQLAGAPEEPPQNRELASSNLCYPPARRQSPRWLAAFTGEYRDPETGFIYLRARYYDPTTGQFLTRDPLLHVSGDPYGYAWNNPVNYTDPTGELPILGAVLVGALIGGGFDLGFQMFDNAGDACSGLFDIDWGSVAVWGTLGGTTGALGHGFKAWRAVRGISRLGETGALVSRPSVTDAGLRGILDQVWRRGTTGTAAALRNEIATGLPTRGSWHLLKARERIVNLTRWLNNNPGASAADRTAAQSLIDDLADAISQVRWPL